jgi:uncharacterized membrane protein (UPF0127 family)
MMRAADLLLVLALCACGADDEPGLSCQDNHTFDADAGVADPTVVFLPEGQPEARVRTAVLTVVLDPRDMRSPKNCLLSHLSSLPEDDGGLILLPFTYDWDLDTRNVLIRTDLVFIRNSFTVLGVLSNVEPNSLELSAGGDWRFLLEVNGGWAARHGVGPETAVRFENISVPTLRVEPVAEGVAEEVAGDDDERDREAGHEREPLRVPDLAAALLEEGAPGVRERRPEAEERQ